MPNLSTTATLSGTVYYSNGKPAAGKSIIIKRIVDTNGDLISTDHTLYKTDYNGNWIATVPTESYVYVYADIESLNTYKNGSPVWIGSNSSYELETITANLTYPEQIPVATNNVGNIDLSGYATTGSLSGYSVTSHTHSQYATTGSLSAYSQTSHTHSQYATTGSLSAYSQTSHTHSSYVTTNQYDADVRWRNVYTFTTNDQNPVVEQLNSHVTTSNDQITCFDLVVIGRNSADPSIYHVNRAHVYVYAVSNIYTLINATNIIDVGSNNSSISYEVNAGVLELHITGPDQPMNWTVYCAELIVK